MAEDAAIFVGASDADQYLLLKFGNRHGLVAGATGTGKTVTLQTLAEGFSAYGVPVFMADVKGDLGVASARRAATIRTPSSVPRNSRSRTTRAAPSPPSTGTCSARRVSPCAPP